MKYALKCIINGLINRGAYYISFQQVCGKVLVKGWNTCGINVSFYSDLTEQIITRTALNCQTLVYIL